MSLPLNPTTQEDYRNDMGLIRAPWGVPEETLIPVKPIGNGVPRQNAAQKVQTYYAELAATQTDYHQVATVTANQRVFYLGCDFKNPTSCSIYLEDADTGNIAPSNSSTVVLAQTAQSTERSSFQGFARECNRGIRLRLVNAATTFQFVVVYFMVETIQK